LPEESDRDVTLIFIAILTLSNCDQSHQNLQKKFRHYSSFAHFGGDRITLVQVNTGQPIIIGTQKKKKPH
jgi:hypothetical protein